MAAFSVTTERDRQTSVLSISGELDMATVPQLRDLAVAELRRSECRKLVFDLARLEFIDSTGIGCWVELRNAAIADDRQVVLRSAPPQVLRILAIGGLDRLFIEGPDTAA